MGARRRKDRDLRLPAGVYRKHGAFYLVRQNKWTRLGKAYDEALRTLATLEASDLPPVTVETLIARYEVNELPSKAERHQKNRRQQFKKIRAVFGKTRPDDVTTADVFRFWEERGRTPQAKKEISALSAVLSYGRKIGAVTHDNPCNGMKLPGSQRDRYVSDEEFLAVREMAPKFIGYAMDLALVAGLDGATIRRLERRHVTEEGLRFERGKTKELQLVEWNDELRAVVEGCLREEPRLRRFLIVAVKGKGKGQPLSADGFQTAWQRLMARYKAAGGRRFTFHDLRGKSGSDAKSDEEARDRLGHRDIQTTVRHYRRLPRRAKALSVS